MEGDMKENYDTFFDELIKHEGGFTDDPRDNGNKRGDGHGNHGSIVLGEQNIFSANYNCGCGCGAGITPVTM